MDKFFKIDIKLIKTIIFYATLFFLVMAVGIKHNGLDFDLWARLIMGNYVFHYGHPMFSDVVSYTPTHMWYDPEWLSSAFIYFIRLKFGAVGLTYLKSILVFLTFVVISFALKDRKIENTSPYNIGFYLILVLIAFQSSILVYTVICQLLTFLLMAIWRLLL